MPYVIAVIVVLIILFYVVWIASIYAMRVLGFLIACIVIVTAFTFIAGLIWGVVLPLRVLRGHAAETAKVATPQSVRDGKIFKGAPKGAAKEFGWDHAWPLYVPYQLRFDAAAVRREAKYLATAVHDVSTVWWPTSGKVLMKAFLGATRFLILRIPAYGFILGLFSGILLWMTIVALIQALVVGAQWITTRLLRIRESRHMKKHSATVKCTRCYRETNMPSYRCPNPECPRIHRDVNPGPLGVRSRICECEAKIPLTVAAASRVLTAHCPFCEAELPQGAGSRRVVVAPVFGSVGSGKTQFLATTAVSLRSMSEDEGTPTKLTALTPAAEQFLASSVEETSAGSAPLKTQHHDRPEGYPFLITGHGSDVELHLMDAAGENFVHSGSSESLGYLDLSTSLLFLLDPLTIPEVREQLGPSGVAVQVAQGRASDAYASVVDRLRDSGEDLRKKKLAVVVTKADVVAQIFASEPLPNDSAGVRAWLYSHGGDNLVRRIEADFQEVGYFAVDSTPGTPLDSPAHPLRVVDWALINGGAGSLSAGSGSPAAGAVDSETSGHNAPEEHSKEAARS
ncbi:TRAFAC clade GTPase domain-containing protein [Arthrobacter zhaoxinii]|uniref:TRAFAC clade GTPase domain-containing protein n=1 Tax=Arthrobacter zhaoxinii TaxID=2964616 RepID=UPI002103DEFC|nr:hypothetical protein [Arthrobacter zhaoxinii]MCQ2001133.1 hypothetical protein [Arthrobacter zhaoxinii]